MVVMSSYKVKARHFRFSLSTVKDIYMLLNDFQLLIIRRRSIFARKIYSMLIFIVVINELKQVFSFF